jgi:hypothetical protein
MLLQFSNIIRLWRKAGDAATEGKGAGRGAQASKGQYETETGLPKGQYVQHLAMLYPQR